MEHLQDNLYKKDHRCASSDIRKIDRAWRDVEHNIYSRNLNLERLSPQEKKEVLVEAVKNVD